jgi:ribosome-binding factor A
MPEQRGREHHRERLADGMRDEIGALLEGELADPRIGLASVTEVKLSPDGRALHVFVNVAGTDDEAVSTMEGLNAAKGYIRREVGSRMRLRVAPELHFHLDQSLQQAARIDELLRRSERKKKKP